MNAPARPVNETAQKTWTALTWPNRISLLRLLLVWPFVLLLLNQRELGWARHAALGIFLVMGVSDFIDGLLARRLNARTRLGAILDPLADKVLIVCSVVVLSSPTVAPGGLALPNWVVAGYQAEVENAPGKVGFLYHEKGRGWIGPW